MRGPMICLGLMLAHCLAVQVVHNKEDWSEIPVQVTPVDVDGAPSDAEILFDGTNLDAWSNESGDPATWSV